MRCDQTPAWQSLQREAQRWPTFDLRQAFASDAHRVDAFSQAAPHLWADLSKNHIDGPTEALLLALAEQTGVAAQRDAMFLGEPINTSEQRAVMHWLLRQPASSLSGPLAEPLAQVHQGLQAMLAYAEQVRAERDITDVVHIGIGGSDLGPQMAVQALQHATRGGPRVHFISTVDGHELAAALTTLRPRHTLFLIASKTFSTLETLTNARSALDWFTAQGGADVARHFVALTAQPQRAADWGIRTCFGFWDWVGGRYSLWSSIGLPIAIAVGASAFEQLLEGAHAMDQHFAQAPLAQNLPVRLGLLDVWYRNFLGHGSRSLAPYHHGLRRLPAYLQQLEMESNGKRVDRTGQVLPFSTAPVIWGEPGTNGQHAYFQMLHQGREALPVEFIAVKRPSHALAEHHELLLSSALAQAQALMLGRSQGDAQRDCPGNRPSTFLLLDALTPASLGALIALYEHRVFVSGAVWGLNSFDQWGVELGKQLAGDLRARWRSGDSQGLDASTAALLARLR